MSRSSKYRRSKPSRDPLPTGAYAVEGDNTEVEYIDELAKDRRLGKRLKFVSAHSEPLSVVRGLISEKRLSEARGEHRDYWLAVFDAEFTQARKDGIARARKLARKHGIVCVENNPSFEYWLRLHFSGDDRPYGSQKEVEADLTRFVSGYSKQKGVMRELMPRFIPRIDAACENARRLSNCGEYGNCSEMPSFIDAIDAMCNKGRHR